MRRAIELLGRDGLEVVRVSKFRDTDPVDYVDQPRFLNAAVAVETDLSPRELLDRLLAVEHELGRAREGPRFGPRTIDLDLVRCFDRATMCEVVRRTADLTLPHPAIGESDFWRQGLAELAHTFAETHADRGDRPC